MSGFLNQTCTISVYSESINASGTTDFSLSSQTANVPCQYQPDVSGEIIIAKNQMGRTGGKLFVLASQSINNDNIVTVNGETLRVIGPPVQASGASTKWVTVDREVL